MNLHEALARAETFDRQSEQFHTTATIAAITLAAEVRRLQAENASLRLYSPAQRAQETIQTAPVGRTNFAFFGVETDEEFAAKGRAYAEVAG